jgi:hypothetical protein
MASKQVSKEKDVDYTVPALIALVAIVVFTALFFAQDGKIAALSSTNKNVVGQAFGVPNVDPDAPTDCMIQSWCDGSRLVRQREDCTQYIAFCQYGCDTLDGQAVCL